VLKSQGHAPRNASNDPAIEDARSSIEDSWMGDTGSLANILQFADHHDHSNIRR
jgi:hypothetical protein